MKKILVLFVFPLLLNAQSPYKKIRVLFLGNSYTYVNNLPLLVHDLALAKGDTLVYDSYSPGGYTFNNHSGDPMSLSKISAGNWDYVVLQAQSQEPSFSPGQVSNQTLPYAIKLDTTIKYYNPCAHTVFYETWGRKYGDASNCASYPPVCTYTGMQDRLRDSYKLFADTVHDIMAPVGEAFRLAIATNTAIEFYWPDQSHPSLEGSYLAAAVFYETLFQKSVLSSTYSPGIASATVSLLNSIAHQLVTDSMQLTNIPKYMPKASFTINPSGLYLHHFNSGNPGFTHLWYFGDGQISTFQNPSHSYTVSGTYQVSMVIFNDNGCRIDSVSMSLPVLIPTGLNDNISTLVSLSPNPCSEYLRIKAGTGLGKNALIEVFGVSGRLIYTGPFTGNLNTSAFDKGLYYIRIYDGRTELRSQFVKAE